MITFTKKDTAVGDGLIIMARIAVIEMDEYESRTLRTFDTMEEARSYLKAYVAKYNADCEEEATAD